MFEIQCGKKQQDDRVCMGHFWICATMLVRMRWPLPEKHVIVYLACKPFRKLTHIRSASLRFCL